MGETAQKAGDSIVTLSVHEARALACSAELTRLVLGTDRQMLDSAVGEEPLETAHLKLLKAIEMREVLP